MPAPPRPTRQPTGAHHLAVGDVLVTAINDGYLEGAFDYMVYIDAAEAEQMYISGHRIAPPRITVNTFLVDLGGRLVLIDGGCGSGMGPTLGAFAGNLAALGIPPESVDVILATHLHPDHVGGLVTETGQPVFPNAELIVHAAEPAFWQNDANAARAASEFEQMFFRLARSTLDAYRGRLRTTQGGEVVPGVSVVPEPGHTPGHCGWLISSGGDQLLIWGDIVHMPGVQFARPDAGMAFDVDAAQARATRQRIFDMAATDRLRVAGMHLDFPAFGHVARAGEGYAFIPEVWQPAP